ncbi:hypothetical protein M0Q28_02025 [Patescibacteria group bacterium]|nr:hypothetical protein [Patescibacteria group bacterium]
MKAEYRSVLPQAPKPKAERQKPEHEVMPLLTATERIARAHDRMMEYMKHELGDEDHVRGPLEKLKPSLTLPQEYADMRFKPDLYIAEPAVIDDMEAAKAEGDLDRVERVRNHLRAMSWDTHGRTDDEVAKTIAKELLEETKAEASGEPRNPFEQRGFDFSDPDVEEWERVIKTLEDIECKGDKVEPATRFVEKKVIEAWRDLIRPFREKKGERSEWPTSYPVAKNPPKLTPEVQKAVDHLVKLRHVRDQLYYHRLFPSHCMYAQRSKTK